MFSLIRTRGGHLDFLYEARNSYQNPDSLKQDRLIDKNLEDDKSGAGADGMEDELHIVYETLE